MSDVGDDGRPRRESLMPTSLADAPGPSGAIAEGPRFRGVGSAFAAALASPVIWLVSAIVLIGYEDGYVPGGAERYSFASMGPFYSAVFVAFSWGAPTVFVLAVGVLLWALGAWGLGVRERDPE